MPGTMSEKLEKLANRLERKKLLVGIPNDAKQPAGGKGNPAPLWVIGYTQEHGDDELRIPPRPFLVPGVESVKGEIVDQMAKGARNAMDGDLSALDKGFTAAGLIAQHAVRQKMREGPFQPLAPATIAARATRRNGDSKLVNSVSTRNARKFRKLQAEGVPVEVLNEAGLATPLIDTGALLNSVQFAVKG